MILHEITCLESLVALSQSCSRLRTVISQFDGSLVRHRVLERVPWMRIGEAGTGLVTWMDAARLIVARKRSVERDESESRGWIVGDRYSLQLEEIVDNMDIEYVEPVEIEKGGNLPASFEPMFRDEIMIRGGTLTGRFMEDEWEGDSDEEGQEDANQYSDRYVNLTTMKVSNTHPERPKRASWSGWISSTVDETTGMRTAVNPITGLTIVHDTAFEVLQETDRWILLRTEGYPDWLPLAQAYDLYYGEHIPLSFINRSRVKMRGDKSFLFLNQLGRGETCYVRPNGLRVFVSFIPDTSCAIVFEFKAEDDKHMTVSYLNLETKAETILMKNLPSKLDRYEEFYDDDEFHAGYDDFVHPSVKGSQRQLVITYGGILYLNIYGEALIPLWVDLSNVNQGKAGVNMKTMKSMILVPINSLDYNNSNNTHGIVRSTDGRWASQILGGGRRVVDLATGKTYFAYNSALEKLSFPPFEILFVEEATSKNNRPTFYSFRIKTSDCEGDIVGKRLSSTWNFLLERFYTESRGRARW